MKFPSLISQISQISQAVSMARRRSARTGWQRAMGLVLYAGVVGVGLTPVVGGGMPQFPKLAPEIRRIPDANEQDEINRNQSQKRNVEAINLARKKLIADESTVLLRLATDLKSEVDKTNKDTLSLRVVRKADEIERLAHSVKEKMKLTVGAD